MKCWSGSLHSAKITVLVSTGEGSGDSLTLTFSLSADDVHTTKALLSLLLTLNARVKVSVKIVSKYPLEVC